MSIPHRPEQGHSRHASSDSRRVAMPRRSTRGPLDLEDDSPISTQPSTPVLHTHPPTPALQTPLPPSPAPAAAAPPRVASPASSLLPPTFRNPRTRSTSPARTLDLTPLLRPSLYAPIPTTNIAAPFLDASQQPAPDADLDTLLSQHRYRHAAARAADTLTSGAVLDTPRILELYHTRLACLVLTSQPDLAAKEGKLLSDLLARESGAYPRPERDVFINQVPWPLRLLLLRLQTLASGDLRRGIMALYALGSECRILALKAKTENDIQSVKLWKTRLSDLGLRVAGELIQMGEFETAKRHLHTLNTEFLQGDPQKQDMVTRQTLLHLRIGDVSAAKQLVSTFSPLTSDINHAILESLISLCSSDVTTALPSLKTLHENNPSNELVAHNLGIAYLYANDVTSCSEILESLVDEESQVFPALLFNLATVYELRTERARDRKLELVDKVAGIEGQRLRVGGFDKGLAEFKLV